MVDGHGSLSKAAAHDVQATFCATLVDQWIACGVSHAVIAPGSRSTPMALALAGRDEIAVHVVHDERVAAFVALGIGVSGRPALLVCTSGTAAANFFPAVVEAGLSEIPMIVLTADRPEELRNVGAPQTIDQIDLYGGHVRWSHDAAVASADEVAAWRPLANTAWQHSVGGPVQLNLPFREPLLGVAGSLPGAVEAPVAPARIPGPDAPPDAIAAERGVLLAGSAHGQDPAEIAALVTATGWPLIADPLSGLRSESDVVSADALMRSAKFVDAHVPDVIVRIGRPSTSKVLAQWTANCGATLIQVGGPGRIDPDHNVAAVCDLAALTSAVVGAQRNRQAVDRWRQQWIVADERAAGAIASTLAGHDQLTEPSVARLVADHLPVGSRLTVSSSMPVRDLEWFGGAAAVAHCNRGANGIDGVMSTAVGRALEAADGAEYVLIGDLAFVHDSNALLALARRDVDVRVVVVDNDGGGIFSFLPQASALASGRFEQLFGTPLGADVVALAAGHGLPTATASTPRELIAQLGTPGSWVCRVPSTRQRNVEIHEELHVAAVAAIDADV